MPMNPEIKARWVAALRSGEYKQGKNKLCSDGKFCCLGVLCDLYSKDHSVEPGQWADNGTGKWYFGSKYALPTPVIEWAETGTNSPMVKLLTHKDYLAALNDAGTHNFNDLADLIEAQL